MVELTEKTILCSWGWEECIQGFIPLNKKEMLELHKGAEGIQWVDFHPKTGFIRFEKQYKEKALPLLRNAILHCRSENEEEE